MGQNLKSSLNLMKYVFIGVKGCTSNSKWLLDITEYERWVKYVLDLKNKGTHLRKFWGRGLLQIGLENPMRYSESSIKFAINFAIKSRT